MFAPISGKKLLCELNKKKKNSKTPSNTETASNISMSGRFNVFCSFYTLYERIYLIAIKMEIEEIQFLSGFDGAVTTFHSIVLHCIPLFRSQF